MCDRATISPGDVDRAFIYLPIINNLLHHLLCQSILITILHLLLLNLRYHAPQYLDLLVFLFNFLIELVVLRRVLVFSARRPL